MLRKILKHFFIPHQGNNYHPHSTRVFAFFIYSLILLILNYLVFPLTGINSNRVFAADLTPDTVLELTNKERQKLGLPVLEQNEKLNSAAFFKGTDMIEKGYWSHFGPNGETPWQFIENSGYTFSFAGENLAKDFTSSESAVQAWMESKSHRENILNDKFTQTGIAIIKGKIDDKETVIIVQMFARPLDLSYLNTVPQQNNPIRDGSEDNGLLQPEITLPSDESVVNKNAITIEGYSPEGNTVKVYSNNKVIGELPNENAAFTGIVILEDSDNKVFVKSYELNTDRISPPSEPVNVKVDKVAPQWEYTNLFFKIDHGKLTTILSSSENLQSVEGDLGGKIYSFARDTDLFFLEIQLDKFKEGNLQIKITDEAGNINQKTFALNETVEGVVSSASLLSNTPQIIYYLSATNLQPITSTSQKINYIILGFIYIFIVVDAILLLRSGKKRERSSHYSLNLGLILLMVMGSLFI